MSHDDWLEFLKGMLTFFLICYGGGVGYLFGGRKKEVAPVTELKAFRQFIATCSACAFRQAAMAKDEIERAAEIEAEHAVSCRGSISLAPEVPVIQASPETREALAAMTAKWLVGGTSQILPGGHTLEELQDKMQRNPRYVGTYVNPYILRQPPPLPKPDLDLFPKVRRIDRHQTRRLRSWPRRRAPRRQRL